MVIYEIGYLSEYLPICLLVICVLGMSGGVIKGIPYLNGRYKLILVIPFVFFSFLLSKILDDFSIVNMRFEQLQSRNYLEASGTLKGLEIHRGGKEVHHADIETIKFENTEFIRVNPRLNYGGSGCYSGFIGDSLERYVNKNISIAFVNGQSGHQCILKIELISKT
ncbi:hypothetical protein ACFSJY_11485 [Thalassotalea euphylliae]|uniref:hypothetical protein n=1 Tax=Thalassotalea euphylliae TaxID=1655234 RepID=UPI0036441EEE